MPSSISISENGAPMPYLISTYQKEPVIPVKGDNGSSLVLRCAVATLDEARRNADALCLANQSLPDADTAPVVESCWEIGEQGGKVGPLPDGTIIEVEPIWWADLRERAGLDRDGFTLDADTLKAFNAKQAA